VNPLFLVFLFLVIPEAKAVSFDFYLGTGAYLDGMIGAKEAIELSSKTALSNQETDFYYQAEGIVQMSLDDLLGDSTHFIEASFSYNIIPVGRNESNYSKSVWVAGIDYGYTFLDLENFGSFSVLTGPSFIFLRIKGEGGTNSGGDYLPGEVSNARYWALDTGLSYRNQWIRVSLKALWSQILSHDALNAGGLLSVAYRF
tara:strand:- start:925 stop:1524 length:600 start_codon:yes stop_codon:yes gene_type:complete